MRVVSRKSLGTRFLEFEVTVCDAIVSLTTDRVSDKPSLI